MIYLIIFLSLYVVIDLLIKRSKSKKEKEQDVGPETCAFPEPEVVEEDVKNKYDVFIYGKWPLDHPVYSFIRINEFDGGEKKYVAILLLHKNRYGNEGFDPIYCDIKYLHIIEDAYPNRTLFTVEELREAFVKADVPIWYAISLGSVARFVDKTGEVAKAFSGSRFLEPRLKEETKVPEPEPTQTSEIEQ